LGKKKEGERGGKKHKLNPATCFQKESGFRMAAERGKKNRFVLKKAFYRVAKTRKRKKKKKKKREGGGEEEKREIYPHTATLL